MKKILLSLFFSSTFLLLHAQDCGSYFPMKPGNSYTLSSYNDKDKLTGTVTYTVVSLSNVADFTVAQLHCDIKDDRGKLTDSTTYTYKCKGADMYIDMKNFVSQQQLEAYKDMQISVSGSDMMVPGNLSAGQSLQDGSMHMDITNNNMPFATIDVNMTNRKVQSQENITVPAGTFNCYIITSDFSMKVATMGMGFPMTMTEKEWYSYGVGMVRSEVYNKSGKLTGYSVLTQVVK